MHIKSDVNLTDGARDRLSAVLQKQIEGLTYNIEQALKRAGEKELVNLTVENASVSLGAKVGK
jgi:hypothetical protein